MKNNKPTFVFLTGLGVDPVISLDFLKKISPDADIILPDYSQFLQGGCQSLLDIANCIDDKLPQDAILFGWSLGALIAILLCHIKPDKYARLITLASSPKFISTHSWPGITSANILKFKDLALNNFDELWEYFVTCISFPNTRYELKKNLNKCDFNFYLNILIKADLTDIMSEIKSESLHIFGDSDSIVPVGVAHHMKEKYPAMNIRVVRGAGHALFCSHGYEVVSMVKDFINLLAVSPETAQ